MKRKAPECGFMTSDPDETIVQHAVHAIPKYVDQDMKLGCIQLICWLHHSVSPCTDTGKRIKQTMTDGIDDIFRQLAPETISTFLARFHVVLHPHIFHALFDEFRHKFASDPARFRRLLNAPDAKSGQTAVEIIVSLICDGTIGTRALSLNVLRTYLSAGATTESKCSLLLHCLEYATGSQSHLDVVRVLIDANIFLLHETVAGKSIFEHAVLAGPKGLAWLRFVAQHSARDENLNHTLFTTWCLRTDVSVDSIAAVLALPAEQFSVSPEDAAVAFRQQPLWFVQLCRLRSDTVLKFLCRPIYDLDSAKATVPEQQTRAILACGKEIPLPIATRLLEACNVYTYKRRLTKLTDSPDSVYVKYETKRGVTITPQIFRRFKPIKRQLQILNVDRKYPIVPEMTQYTLEWLMNPPDIRFQGENGEGFGVFCTWLELALEWCLAPEQGLMKLVGSDTCPCYTFDPQCTKLQELRFLGLLFAYAFTQRLRFPYRLAGHIYGAIFGLKGHARHYTDMYPSQNQFLIKPLDDFANVRLADLAEQLSMNFVNAQGSPIPDTREARQSYAQSVIQHEVADSIEDQKAAFLSGVYLLLDPDAYCSYGQALSRNRKWDLSSIWFAESTLTLDQFKQMCSFASNSWNTPENQTIFWKAIESMHPTACASLFRFITGHSVRPHLDLAIQIHFTPPSQRLPEARSCGCWLLMPVCETAAIAAKRLEWALFNGDSLFRFV